MIIILNYFFGASIGSFLTLVYERTQAHISIVLPRSYCNQCQHSLGIIDLIPGISYLFFGGKCRFCHHHYGSASFQIENYLGLAFILYYFNFSALALLISLTFAFCYLTDLFELKIYTLLPLILTGLILPWEISHLEESGFLVGGLGLFGLITQGVGFGDLLLIFPVCLYLGIMGTLKMLLIACLLVIISYLIRRNRQKIPFIPYLAWGFLIVEFINLTLCL